MGEWKSLQYRGKVVEEKAKAVKKKYSYEMGRIEEKLSLGEITQEQAQRRIEHAVNDTEDRLSQYLEKYVKIQEEANKFGEKVNSIELDIEFKN